MVRVGTTVKLSSCCTANYKLPDEGDLFDKVEFIELQREESQKLVEQYNKEGEDAGFGQKKGFRGGFAERRGGFVDRRGGYGKVLIGGYLIVWINGDMVKSFMKAVF